MMSHVVGSRGFRGCQGALVNKLEARTGVAAANQEGTDENGIYKTEQFRMFCFKVLPCSKRFCHDWTKCPFAHPGEKARRRDPRVYQYSGKACPEMKATKHCPRSSSCPYAHNVFEYWLHPSRYRTQPCNDGATCGRRVCFFAHTLEELRVEKDLLSNESGNSKLKNRTTRHSPLLSASEGVDGSNKENQGGEGFQPNTHTQGIYLANRQNTVPCSKVGKAAILQENVAPLRPVGRKPSRDQQNEKQRWDEGVPSWSMSGASDGQVTTQPSYVEEYENCTRILSDIGINDWTQEDYSNFQAQQNVPYFGENAGSNSFEPFPQMQPSRSAFQQVDNIKSLHYPPAVGYNNSGSAPRVEFTGPLGGQRKPLSPRHLQPSGDSFHNQNFMPSTGYEGNPLQISQTLNLEGHNMCNSVLSNYFPCYNLSDGILGPDSWSRRLHEEIAYRNKFDSWVGSAT